MPSRSLLVALATLTSLFLTGGVPDARAAEESSPLLARIESGLTPQQRAELHYLLHLGWRIVPDASVNVAVAQGGRPGWRESIPDAQAHGDLVIRFPPAPAPNQIAWFGNQLPAIADSAVSRLAYQHRVQRAVETATQKLAQNAACGRYIFPEVLIIESPWFQCDPPRAWREIETERTMYVACCSARRAVEGWYSEEVVGECYVAQWVSVYATQYELYGPAFFDEAFRPETLVIGRPHEMVRTPFGQYIGYDRPHPYYALVVPPEYQYVDPGLALAGFGPRAFAGVTGVAQAPPKAATSNENFTIVSMTPAAVHQLREIGGFAGIERLTLAAKDWYERTKPLLVCGTELERYRDGFDEALSQPVFEGTIIYVHPYGVKPLRDLVEQKLTQKDFALQVRVYANGVADAFYRHYHEAWTTKWLRSMPPVPPVPSALPVAPVPPVAPATPARASNPSPAVPVARGGLPPPRVRVTPGTR